MAEPQGGEGRRRILITAGPTREAIDPVRFLSNRSSGKMGYALAAAAVARGLDVTLISGPVSLSPPPRVRCIAVESAAEMCAAVVAAFPEHDALIMVAAVADWRPRRVSAEKLKKASMRPVIELERTDDILETIRPMKGMRSVVGFAAETADLHAEARRKLRAKGLDGIVANDVSSSEWGMASDSNRVTLIPATGEMLELSLMAKVELADRILDWVLSLPVAAE